MKDVSEAFENIRSEKTATAISGFLSIFPEETSPEALGVLSDREEAGRAGDISFFIVCFTVRCSRDEPAIPTVSGDFLIRPEVEGEAADIDTQLV